MSEDPAASPPITPPWRGKKIVIFADGTGNSFATQESNVWRLYSALDKTEKSGVTPAELQLARYIPGVGTSSNRVLRLIDGATGIGVPSNVRKLYRFLCWNWQPGDEIHLFGFSRGAFTVRTLAGMLRWQGLMPLMIGDRPVTDAEMKRNSMRAWEAYRASTAPLWDGGLKMAPWIGALRWLRDRTISAKRRLFGQPTHAEVLAARDPRLRPALPGDLPGDQRGGEVRIRYMGLFDTVEAYGFPFAGLREAWSWLVWPILFRNRVCAKIVTRADHVLALDDERKTFHPLQFDQTDAGTDEAPTLVRETWFAGMHSDVGGGYPDDAVAMDPLLWIMAAAESEGLRFGAGRAEGFAARRYPRALIHDSRAGLAASYRYAPRPKPAGAAHGRGAPVLHRSVLQKIQTGADGYAPLLLPEGASVCDGPASHDTCGPAPMARTAVFDDKARRLIGWRAKANRAQIALAVLFVVLPLLNRLGLPLWPTLWDSGKAIVLAWVSALRLSFGPLCALYGDIWPGAALLVAAWVVLWWWGGGLQGRIKDQALRVWRITG
ncbi:DUF2235 domain-containing protein [Tabrizicola sp.]|uniref:DUF2235 domain-containing protein n=1 Tax=Tabrizicola sp. TaxID=2005166 RepID=UPI002FDD61D2